MNKIGNRIKRERIRSGLTQQELGDKLFVSDKTVSSWEQGRTIPDFESINSISKVLNCTFSSILFGDINSSNVEVEVKFKLNENEYKQVLGLIKDKSIKLDEAEQIDYYYETNNFNNNEWLRIRNTNNKNILSYKKWHQNKFCDEYEVYIDNKDNLEKILNLLGAKLLVTVKKNRIKYIYENKYEISFDKVEYLGLFVEIEIIDPDTSKPFDEFDKLIEISKDLNINLNNLSDKRYPEYFL